MTKKKKKKRGGGRKGGKGLSKVDVMGWGKRLTDVLWFDIGVYEITLIM